MSTNKVAKFMTLRNRTPTSCEHNIVTYSLLLGLINFHLQIRIIFSHLARGSENYESLNKMNVT